MEAHAVTAGVWLSAKTGDGIELLTDTIADAVGFNYREEGGFMARERHFASLRSAVGFALIGAVVAEYLGANAGVGYRIQASESQLDTSGVFGGLAILMGLVFLVDTGIRAVQRRFINWKAPAL